ncbi:hypothetical protein TNCV_1786491 [Trichonephila clavipes]|nr:hypothetical protein TNCV_1786491 [Trichonephila clavipes]
MSAVSMMWGPQATEGPTCVTTVPLTGLSFLEKGTEGVSIRGPLRTSYATSSNHDHKLVASVVEWRNQVLTPLKTHHVEGLMLVKSDGA